MTQTLPDDYDPIDSFRERDAMDVCAHCSIVIHQTKYTGPIYDSDGTEYEHYTESDPMNRPFFCKECWKELEANQKRANNQSLGDFA